MVRLRLLCILTVCDLAGFCAFCYLAGIGIKEHVSTRPYALVQTLMLLVEDFACLTRVTSTPIVFNRLDIVATNPLHPTLKGKSFFIHPFWAASVESCKNLFHWTKVYGESLF